MSDSPTAQDSGAVSPLVVVEEGSPSADSSSGGAGSTASPLAFQIQISSVQKDLARPSVIVGDPFADAPALARPAQAAQAQISMVRASRGNSHCSLLCIFLLIR
jgi:hypothetical protein